MSKANKSDLIYGRESVLLGTALQVSNLFCFPAWLGWQNETGTTVLVTRKSWVNRRINRGEMKANTVKWKKWIQTKTKEKVNPNQNQGPYCKQNQSYGRNAEVKEKRYWSPKNLEVCAYLLTFFWSSCIKQTAPSVLTGEHGEFIHVPLT